MPVHALALLLFSVLVIFKVEVQAIAWDFNSSQVKFIHLSGAGAQLLIRKGTVSREIKVSISGAKEASWRANIEGPHLWIQGPEEGRSYNESQVSLILPQDGVSLYVSLADVRGDIENVGSLSLTAFRGQVNARQLGEGVRMFFQNVDFIGTRLLGGLELESYGGKVVIADSRGSLKLRVFSGDMQLDRNDGALLIDSYSSKARVGSQKGSLHLNWGRGDFVMDDFSGRIEGKSSEGQLQLGFKQDVNVDLSATKGKIAVRLPANDGSYINVKTASGEIVVPSPLRAGREGRYKVARGRLNGKQKGNLVISADEATIVIR